MKEATAENSRLNNNAHDNYNKNLVMALNLKSLLDLLNFIEPQCPREDWVKTLMAIKSEFGDAGKDIAKEWSANADNFNNADFESTWKSISTTGGITIATLIHQAKANGWQPEQDQLSREEFAKREKEARQRRREQAKQRELEQKKQLNEHLRVSEKAYKLIEHCQPAPKEHPYLVRKRIKTHGALISNDGYFKGWLIIPIYGSYAPFIGQLMNVQAISPDGDKRFLKGGKKSGGYYPIQWVENAPIVICEGFATGASLSEHYTPEWSVIVAFDSGNLRAVACAFRDSYPNTQIIIGTDSDPQGIKAAEKAAISANAEIIKPDFQEWEDGNDFNDRAILDLGYAIEKHPEAVQGGCHA